MTLLWCVHMTLGVTPFPNHGARKGDAALRPLLFARKQCGILFMTIAETTTANRK